MPRVSVLLTCYNHLAFLPEALESVRAQTFADWDVIALDDGSTDGTREWLDAHASDGKLVFHPANLGTYGSLNVGLEHASGEFVAILNDDDRWQPDKLRAQVELMEAQPELGLVHTNGEFIDARGAPIAGEPLGFAFPREQVGDALIGLLYANKIIASSVLVRRAVFDELGRFEPAYYGSGDWEMWLRIAERYPIGFVDARLTAYRVHGSNTSHQHERIWRDDVRLREWIARKMPEFAQGRDPGAIRRASAHNWACLGTVRVLGGEPRAGRQAYWRSIRLLPWRVKTWVRLLLTLLPGRLFRRTLRAG